MHRIIVLTLITLIAGLCVVLARTVPIPVKPAARIAVDHYQLASHTVPAGGTLVFSGLLRNTDDVQTGDKLLSITNAQGQNVYLDRPEYVAHPTATGVLGDLHEECIPWTEAGPSVKPSQMFYRTEHLLVLPETPAGEYTLRVPPNYYCNVTSQGAALTFQVTAPPAVNAAQ